MKKLNVWIFQTGEPLHFDLVESRPMRAMNLANALELAGHNVVLWSSNFYHQEKRHRVVEGNRILVSPNIEVRLISSPGYRTNIGFQRLWDHAVLAFNLHKELQAEFVFPDIAFVGYPPVEAAAVMTRWLKIRKIPCVIDVKDMWPSIFLRSIPDAFKPIGKILLAPYFYLGKRAMKEATALTSIADGFLEWAAMFAGRLVLTIDRVVPLTSPNKQISAERLEKASNWWDKNGIKQDGTPRFIFIGSHTEAFDIDPIRDAAFFMQSTGINCQFIICGNGPSSLRWKEQMAGLNNVYFPGWIDNDKIKALSLRSTATLAPYKNTNDFVMSIPNKIYDAFSLGLPILSSLKGEVEHLLLSSRAGMIYGKSSDKTLTECLKILINDPGICKEFSNNALSIYSERFSFEVVYGGLVRHLELLTKGKEQFSK
jgi:glycosyltransferase involved in cell wall biosynthesis